jgi:hypothetical protein
MMPTAYFKSMRLVKPTTVEIEKPPLAIGVDSKFVWAGGADVLKTFKRHGFVPPTEYREDFLFKKNREMKDE